MFYEDIKIALLVFGYIYIGFKIGLFFHTDQSSSFGLDDYPLFYSMVLGSLWLPILAIIAVTVMLFILYVVLWLKTS